MRKFLWAVILMLGVVFIIGQFAEMKSIADTLKRGDWRFLLLGLGVEGIWLVNTAACYRMIYLAMGIDEKVKNLLPVACASIFANVVAPIGGVSGAAVFITEARRRGYSPGRAVVAGALFVLFDYAAFLSILGLGLLVFLRRGNLNLTELFATGILLVTALVLATLLLLGMRSERALGRVLAWMANRVNWVLRPFIHREYLQIERAHAFAHDIADGLHSLRRGPRNVVWPLALALTKMVLPIFILLLTFLAFKVPFSIGTLVGGFSIGYLSLIVSPTPSGIGIVEGTLPAALSSLRVLWSDALVVTLAYRAITFWTPLLFGMGAFRWLGNRPQPKDGN